MDDKAQIQEAIKVQGEVVRKLKSEKASKEQVSILQRAWWCCNMRLAACLCHVAFYGKGWLGCHLVSYSYLSLLNERAFHCY